MIDKMDLSNKAYRLRKQIGEDEYSPIDIFHVVQNIDNLTLVHYPLGKNISGLCYRGEKSSIIVINSEMSLGRQRFSLAHELYHLFFDDDKVTTVSMTQIGKGDLNEKKADQFASYFLVPQQSLYNRIRDYKNKHNITNLGLEDIVNFEQYYGVSHKAMLFRLVDESEIDREQSSKMESGVVEVAARLGYDTSLYLPTPEGKRMNVLGHYISMSEKLLEREFISCGKYEELLLDAFRDDIVFGIKEEESVYID